MRVDEKSSQLGTPPTTSVVVTTTPPTTSVVVTTTPPTTVVTSGAPTGATTTTTTGQFQLITPAVTPWNDPTGLGTAQLIRDEVNRIIGPLKNEIRSLKSKIDKLTKILKNKIYIDSKLKRSVLTQKN